MTVLLLTPLVTVAVSSLYFVYAFIMDRALAHFVHQKARKALDRARSDPNSSPEHVRDFKTFSKSVKKRISKAYLIHGLDGKKIRNK